MNYEQKNYSIVHQKADNQIRNKEASNYPKVMLSERVPMSGNFIISVHEKSNQIGERKAGITECKGIE